MNNKKSSNKLKLMIVSMLCLCVTFLTACDVYHANIADSCFDEGDYNEAFYHYKKAAELGNVNAQASLGVCYVEGIGIYPDVNRGIYWLKKAAANGSVEAREYLSR